jgi:periplasmic protein TonB
MNDLVSSALAARAHPPEGLRRMIGVSCALHAAVLTLVAVGSVVLHRAQAPPDTVMTISLGGAPGPVSGGMTPISARPIQKVEPAPELPKPEPVRPPAPKPPEMVEPKVEPKSAKVPPKEPVRQAPEQARSSKPTTGTKPQEGRASAETGAQTDSIGLSTGGGGTSGQINLGNFCAPEYLGQMVGLIQRNWNSRQPQQGIVIVRYTIQRDGALTDVQVRQSSGFTFLDLLAQRSVMQTRALPPLPACYPNQTLTINLTFEYIR